MKRRPVGRMLFLYQRRAFPTGRLCIFYRFFLFAGSRAFAVKNIRISVGEDNTGDHCERDDGSQQRRRKKAGQDECKPHQAEEDASQTVSFTPHFRIFQCPWRFDTKRIIGADLGHVISDDKENNAQKNSQDGGNGKGQSYGSQGGKPTGCHQKQRDHCHKYMVGFDVLLIAAPSGIDLWQDVHEQPDGKGESCQDQSHP